MASRRRHPRLQQLADGRPNALNVQAATDSNNRPSPQHSTSASMHLRPRLPLVAAATAALLVVSGTGALAQEQPEQAAGGDRPSVGYTYRVETVNAREATVVSLEVAVDTANGRSNATYWNSHGVDTLLIRNDLNRACLLSPVAGAGPAATRDCTCYPLSPAAAAAAAAASSLPLPEPISNASFRESFQLLGPEDFGGREVDRYGLSLTTAKKQRAGGGELTDSLEVTALLDRETGLPLVVAFYNGTSSYTAESTAARTEYYRDVALGVPVSPALFEVPDTCVLAAEDEADEALSVILHRLRYKPFAATAAAAPTPAPTPATTTPNLRPPVPQEGTGQAAAAEKGRSGVGGEGEGDPVKANLALIHAHNARTDVSYSLAANRFVHVRSPAFFDRHAVRAASPFLEENEASLYPIYQPTAPTTAAAAAAATSPPPTTVDRRADGFVTPVHDQGTCLGSWAAASAAALETAAAVAGAPLARLSVQRLLDCVVTPAPGAAIVSKGCSGGWPLTALGHVRDVEPTGMLPLEEDVPYFEVTGACPAAPAGAAVAGKNSSGLAAGAGGSVRLKEVALVPQGDEEALAAAVVEHGAVVVSIQAMDDFWLYGGGIYDSIECTGRSLDYHLTIVGFTQDAWIAKASLGAAWGEQGYIRLARNKNMCGVAEWAAVPIVG